MTTVGGPPLARNIPVSATLAANQTMAARRRRGLPVLPLGFGEAGLPVHPALREALAAASGANGYGPVAGHLALRQAAAGYWARNGLPTSPGQVICGPGSKPLLFVLRSAIGGDVALPRPSWVSYAAQAAMIGIRPHFVPAPTGRGDTRPGRPCRRGARGGRGRAADPVGAGHPARQPDRAAAVPGYGCRVVRGRGRLGAGHRLRRDLPRPGARPLRGGAKPGPGRARADLYHHRAE
jgi:aspartate aminotransferase